MPSLREVNPVVIQKPAISKSGFRWYWVAIAALQGAMYLQETEVFIKKTWAATTTLQSPASLNAPAGVGNFEVMQIYIEVTYTQADAFTAPSTVSYMCSMDGGDCSLCHKPCNCDGDEVCQSCKDQTLTPDPLLNACHCSGNTGSRGNIYSMACALCDGSCATCNLAGIQTADSPAKPMSQFRISMEGPVLSA